MQVGQAQADSEKTPICQEWPTFSGEQLVMNPEAEYRGQTCRLFTCLQCLTACIERAQQYETNFLKLTFSSSVLKEGAVPEPPLYDNSTFSHRKAFPHTSYI